MLHTGKYFKGGHITQTLAPMWLFNFSQVSWITQWFNPSHNRNINYLANIGLSLISLCMNTILLYAVMELRVTI